MSVDVQQQPTQLQQAQTVMDEKINIQTDDGKKPAVITLNDIQRTTTEKLGRALELINNMPAAQQQFDPAALMNPEKVTEAPPVEAPPVVETPASRFTETPAAPAQPEDPLEMAYRMVRSTDPRLQEIGKEMFVKLTSPQQPQEPAAPATPNWEERASAIRAQVEASVKEKYAFVEREYEENDPSAPPKYVKKYDPHVETPLFQEMLENKVQLALLQEQSNWQREQYEQAVRHQQEQVSRQQTEERARIHNQKVEDTALVGFNLNKEGTEKTSDYFKDETGKVIPQRVKLWKSYVSDALVGREAELVRVIERIPQDKLNDPNLVSGTVLSYLWPEFAEAVGKPTKATNLTTAPGLLTTSTQPQKTSIPNNLLGKPGTPPTLTPKSDTPVQSEAERYLENARQKLAGQGIPA